MNRIIIVTRLLVYGVFFLAELVKANFQVVRWVLSPRMTFHSAAIRYPSRAKTTTEILILANSITLTPGTLVVDVNPATGEMLVHAMLADDAEQVRRDLYTALERRLLWALRGRAA